MRFFKESSNVLLFVAFAAALPFLFAAIQTTAIAAPHATLAAVTVPGDYPILPVIHSSLKLRLQTILAAGQAQGNHLNVFAKVGDSITFSGEFLHGIGCTQEELAGYGNLATTIDYFRNTTFPESYSYFRDGASPYAYCSPYSNAFNRVSAASVVGWTAADALKPVNGLIHPECNEGELALHCELRVMQPSVALIMFGTNNMWAVSLPYFRADIERLIDETIALGVIPVVSTIPPRIAMPDGTPLIAEVAAANNIIIQIAEERQIPLWNYWGALQAPNMVNQGLKTDGTHPNTYLVDYNITNAVDFSTEGLRYGYNQRNLTAVQLLDKIKRIVIDDGLPDSDAPLPTATVTAPATATPVATPTPSAGVATVIYADTLNSGWKDWSWSTTRNGYNSTPVYRGSQSYAITYTGGWAGFYLHVDPAIDTTLFTHLRFFIHGGDSGGQKIQIKLNQGLPNAVTVIATAASWQQVDIELSALGSPATVSDIFWEDITGYAQPTFFLDEIQLVGNSVPPATPTATPGLQVSPTPNFTPTSSATPVLTTPATATPTVMGTQPLTPSPTPSLVPTAIPVIEKFCSMTIEQDALFVGQSTVRIQVSVPNAAAIKLSNDGGFGSAIWQPYSSPTINWQLRDPGPAIVTLVAYARFRDAAQQPLCSNSALSDDIIYDPLSPTVQITSYVPQSIVPQSMEALHAMTAGGIVTLAAADQPGGSGVAEMRWGYQPDLAGEAWVTYRTTIEVNPKDGAMLFVEVRDAVGNRSAPAMLALDATPAVYLPFILR